MCMLSFLVEPLTKLIILLISQNHRKPASLKSRCCTSESLKELKKLKS